MTGDRQALASVVSFGLSVTICGFSETRSLFVLDHSRPTANRWLLSGSAFSISYDRHGSISLKNSRSAWIEV